MKFGKTETTEIIDTGGSTKTVVENYHDSTRTRPKRVRYEIRHRTDKTDLATLASIAQGLIDDPLKLDTAIRFEETKNGQEKGYHHIIECYTLLEY